MLKDTNDFGISMETRAEVDTMKETRTVVDKTITEGDTIKETITEVDAIQETRVEVDTAIESLPSAAEQTDDVWREYSSIIDKMAEVKTVPARKYAKLERELERVNGLVCYYQSKSNQKYKR